MRLICHKCTNYFLLRNFFFTFLNYPSLIYPLPTSYLPLIYPLSTPPLAQACSLCPIQNSEFKILSLSHNRRCGSPSQPSQPSHTSHTSHLPHTCIVLIVSLIFLTTHLIHYPLPKFIISPKYLYNFSIINSSEIPNLSKS